MPRITPPEDLIEALEALQAKSANSVPDLSLQAGKLAKLLVNGQETRKNDEGIEELQKWVERMNVWVDRVKIKDVTQLSRATNIKSLLSSLMKTLKREADEESDTLPLRFFMDMEDDSPCDNFLRQFGVEVKALEEIACPELRPKVSMVINMDGARIDSSVGGGRGDVGSYNYGEMLHSYAAASVRLQGHLASRNINDPTGRITPRYDD